MHWNRRNVSHMLLASAVLSTFLLALDALEQGQGQFVNPIFHIRAQLAKVNTVWRKGQPFEINDVRLHPCEKFTAENEITRHQEDIRRILVGESESFALTQFGSPTCIVADSTYRWLSESGLSVDVVIRDGEVLSAKLKN